MLGFTSDPRQVRLAVDTLGLPQLLERHPDPLGLLLTELEEQVKQPGEEAARDFLDSIREIAGAALMLGGEQGGSLPVSLLAAPYRVAGQKAYVPAADPA